MENDNNKQLPEAPLRKPKNGPLGFISLFIADDLDEVKKHVLHNIIVPGVKEALVNSFASFINGAGYRRKNQNQYYWQGNGWYPYSSASKPPYAQGSGYSSPQQHPVLTSSMNLTDYENIPFESAMDAEAVLDALFDEADRGPFVPVASIWEYAHRQVPSPTFYDYGWPSNQVSMAKYKMNMVMGCYYICGLPRPISIKK